MKNRISSALLRLLINYEVQRTDKINRRPSSRFEPSYASVCKKGHAACKNRKEENRSLKEMRKRLPTEKKKWKTKGGKNRKSKVTSLLRYWKGDRSKTQNWFDSDWVAPAQCRSSRSFGQNTNQQERTAAIRIQSGQKDVGKRLTAWSVELLLYGTGIKRSCNSPPITFKSKWQR